MHDQPTKEASRKADSIPPPLPTHTGARVRSHLLRRELLVAVEARLARQRVVQLLIVLCKTPKQREKQADARHKRVQCQTRGVKLLDAGGMQKKVTRAGRCGQTGPARMTRSGARLG